MKFIKRNWDIILVIFAAYASGIILGYNLYAGLYATVAG